MKTIFLDYNATAPLRPEAFEAMLPFLKEEFGNPSSVYQLGQRSRKAVEEARGRLASFVGADDPSEIIFTSGGTEANNMAIKGAIDLQKKNGRRVVTTSIEHSSVRAVLKHLADQGVIDMVVVPVQPNGVVRSRDIDDAITPDTALVTVMAANNEVGTIQPIKEIANVCHRKNVLLHTDAVQLAGKLPIRVRDLEADMLSLSGHKFGGPKGVGVLYVKKGTQLHSLIHGGRQEKNRRGGTENVAGIVGMGVAADIELRDLPREMARIKKLRDDFENRLLKEIPLTFRNGDPDQRICNTSNLCFEYVENTALLMALDLAGVSCSIGSACASGSPDPSHVLLAMGVARDRAYSCVRFSFGYPSTEEDVQQAVPLIVQTVARLRQDHPLWKEVSNR